MSAALMLRRELRTPATSAFRPPLEVEVLKEPGKEYLWCLWEYLRDMYSTS